ncbi:REP-associated tyrosine transposase [Pontibacter beigongshangensis]|uniref:REP-associated tyrosine transposase n=1 Tax=Pontibacter beigongshangensis TaxID=2574733 RepID=UPI00164F2E75|nr:transposase [Pontibacter beigongshangensis]
MGSAYQIQNQEAVYFCTFQVVGWVDIFTRKEYRDIILQSFSWCREQKELELFAYVIMSNHVHVVVRSKTGNLSDTIRDLKKFTAKKILGLALTSSQESRRDWMKVVFAYHAKYNKRAGEIQFWTHENHAVELSSNTMIDSRIQYIHQNPVRAGLVEKAEDYLYSSARNYAGLAGLIEVDDI